MRSIGLSIILSLCALPLSAQTASDTEKSKSAVDSLVGEGFTGMQDMPTMPDSIKVDNDGRLEFDSKNGTYLFEGKVDVTTDNGLNLKAAKALIQAKQEIATLTGDVQVRQKSTTDENGRVIPGIQLFADKVTLNAKTKKIILDGNVSIYQGPTLHRGNHAEYHYETKRLNTEGLASKLGPLILESDHFKMVQQGGRTAFVGENAGITTHDVESPNYWIRSGQTTIYPNDRVIFKNLSIYAGDTPVFWFPYLEQPLDADLGLHMIPGARTSWGAYLLTSYGIMLGGEKDEATGLKKDAWLLSKWNFDIRTKRGVGAGLDLYDTRLKDNDNLGWLKYYYLNDRDPSYKRTDEDRGFVNEDRWKFELKHRINLHQQGSSITYADFNINALSDRYFLEDFEPNTYKIDPNPNNEIGIFHRSPKFLAGIYTRLRVNDFYQSDTRLPELFLDQVKGPVWGSPVLHEGQTTLGIYKEYLEDYREKELKRELASLPANDPNINRLNDILDDKGYSRFHTWHEFTLPLNLDGMVSITPRAGIGITSYWDVEGDVDSFTQTRASAGVDASMKFSRVYSETQNKALGIDQLLHIFQPYASFSLLTTNDQEDGFRGIETLSPSTRPPPLAVGRFPATDDLEDWTILRLGGRNTLLSKRDGGSHRWFAIDTYVDLYLNDPESDRSISNLYNDLIWQPLPWVRFDLETQFPVTNDEYNFSELSSSLTFMPVDSAELTVGYRMLNNHPTLQDSNRVDLRTYFRINDLWGLGTYHRLELDDSTLEVQQYAIHRDFDSWITSLGFLIRDNRDSKDEIGLMLNFTLKNFPSVRLPLSIDTE